MTIAVEDLSRMDFSDVAAGDLAPVPPGEVLAREFLEPLGISSERLAQAIGVPHPQIEDIVAGRQKISADTGLRLSRVFGMSDGFWVGLQADYDAANARQRLGSILERIQPFPHHLNPQP